MGRAIRQGNLPKLVCRIALNRDWIVIIPDGIAGKRVRIAGKWLDWVPCWEREASIWDAIAVKWEPIVANWEWFAAIWEKPRV